MSQHPNMEQFLDFCEKQDPNVMYNYHDPSMCAMAQFLGKHVYLEMCTHVVFPCSPTSEYAELREMEVLASKHDNFGDLTNSIRSFIEAN